MGFKLLVLVLFIKIVAARIRLDINIDNDQRVNISYTGTETHKPTEDDINTFKIGPENLIRAYQAYADKYSHINFGDLCWKTNDSEHQVKRVLSIKSASVKSLTMQPVVVVSQDYENSSNHTIKVNTGLTHSIANTLTTSWSTKDQFNVSQDIQYELNLGITRFGGKTDFSFNTNGGVSEEKSKTETIGTTSGMEVELKPGEGVTAVLSANAGYLEIEVVHMASLKGYTGIAWTDRKTEIYHAICDLIELVMEFRGYKNEVTTTETIKFNFYIEPQLKVYDKKTGLLK